MASSCVILGLGYCSLMLFSVTGSVSFKQCRMKLSSDIVTIVFWIWEMSRPLIILSWPPRVWTVHEIDEGLLTYTGLRVRESNMWILLYTAETMSSSKLIIKDFVSRCYSVGASTGGLIFSTESRFFIKEIKLIKKNFYPYLGVLGFWGFGVLGWS